jgi:hypothetical protein
MAKLRKSYRWNRWLFKRLSDCRFKLGEEETEFIEEAIYERVLKIEEESRKALTVGN